MGSNFPSNQLLLYSQERDPLEGFIPHLEAHFCIFLSIVPLPIANVFEVEAKSQSSSFKNLGMKIEWVEKALLGNFSGLLCPLASIMAIVNNVAAKAASFFFKE
ncbi:hypothetical protein SCA6_009759, partial [Theobroma cacao]